MRIEHIAVYVRDLEGARDFFVRYLGAAAGKLYHNPKTNFRSYFLSFADGARLEIMTRPEVIDGEDSMYRSGYAHIAFSLGRAEAVNVLTARLRADGYEVISEPRTTGDGCYESSVADSEGNIIELTI
ncbi:MAG: VOC family protein [Ruminococcus sp.]|nr:VOC family protein [Ruminococcus sp.]